MCACVCVVLCGVCVCVCVCVVGRKEIVEILLEAGMDANCFDGTTGQLHPIELCSLYMMYESVSE